jgi:hypothetical protein
MHLGTSRLETIPDDSIHPQQQQQQLHLVLACINPLAAISCLPFLAVAMRLFLLPISTRRSLIYCERLQDSLKPGSKPPITERITNFASQTWTKWEKAESGWQKHLTNYGNQLLKRIPYEEWGLKSIPPGTNKRIEEVNAGKYTFECLYPGAFMKGGHPRVSQVLRQLGTERQNLHKRRMWVCIAWMPITIPFQLVPV